MTGSNYPKNLLSQIQERGGDNPLSHASFRPYQRPDQDPTAIKNQLKDIPRRNRSSEKPLLSQDFLTNHSINGSVRWIKWMTRSNCPKDLFCCCPWVSNEGQIIPFPIPILDQTKAPQLSNKDFTFFAYSINEDAKSEWQEKTDNYTMTLKRNIWKTSMSLFLFH